MKWIKLDSKKSPSFGKDVLILDEAKGWHKGYLREKTETPEGIKFSFHIYTSGETISNCTHYMEIELPKEIEKPKTGL